MNLAIKSLYIITPIIVAIVGYLHLDYFIPAPIIEGKIIKIYDGDTITILQDKEKLKIRLYGIDAPESNQSFGNESRENLLKLCPLNETAIIKVKDKDKYNRIVGILFCNDINANANQVENGFAWAYKEYSNAYILLEMKAKLESKGLWSEKNPIKPSDFRKEHK